jgi:hypothetical protein
LVPVSTLLFQTFLLASSSFQEKGKKNKEKNNHREEKKCREGRELSFKVPLCPFTFSSRFYPPTFALLFQTFSLTSSFSQVEEKKRKTIEKKKMQRRDGVFFQALTLPSHFWLPLLPSHFCLSVSNVFFWRLFVFKQFFLKKP